MIDSLGAPHTTRQDRGDEDRLRAALAPGGLRLALQPIVTLSGARVAVELIARPRDGTPPDLLFALARAAGVEPALSRAVIGAAIDLADDLPPLPLSINLDPVLIGPLSRELRALLRAAPAGVAVELPESLPIEAPAVVARTARGIGVDLQVDDLGAGLPRRAAEIARLDPSAIKLDRSALRTAVVDRRAATVFAAHLELALRVAPVVIVEGVETRGDLRFLRGVAAGRGSVHAQGYLFGRPQLLPTR